jgi:hypothetical protein
MDEKEKPIRLSEHAKQQLVFRGAAEEQVFDAIRTEEWEFAELGRLECRKDFIYNSQWNNKYYDTQQVRPIFVEESGEIIVVTVYVYYF